MTTSIKNSIRNFVANFANVTDLGDEEDLFGNRAINSLFAMQLVLFVERTFSVQIRSEDLQMDNFRSINSISRLVQRLQTSASGIVNTERSSSSGV